MNTLTTTPERSLRAYDLPHGVRFTKTALILPEDLLPEQWAEVGDYLATAGRAWGVWMGDWAKHGKAKYDAQFVAITMGQMNLPLHGIERFELQAQVLPESRPETFGGGVTPEHLLVVSKRCEDDVDRRRWLEVAEKEGLTPRELQASIRAGQTVKIDTEKRRLNFPSAGAVRRAFEDWTEALGDSWRSTWTQRDCEEVAEDLAPVVKFYNEIMARRDEMKFAPAVEKASSGKAEG
jgi:hypothetical protein